MAKPSPLLVAMLFLLSATQVQALQWGLELGETPLWGSRKVGINLHQELSDTHNLMVSWQRADTLSRDSDSFNANQVPAQDYGLGSLSRSTESTGYRSQLLAQYQPFKFPFYLTYGAIYNAEDHEKLSYASSDTKINIIKPAAFAPAIGLGFSYQYRDWDYFFQWTGSLNRADAPDITISNDHLSSEQIAALKKQITRGYRSKITNRVHLFSMGIRF